MALPRQCTPSPVAPHPLCYTMPADPFSCLLRPGSDMNTKLVNSPFMGRHIVSGKFSPDHAARERKFLAKGAWWVSLRVVGCGLRVMEVRRRPVASVGAGRAGDTSDVTPPGVELNDTTNELVAEGRRVDHFTVFLLVLHTCG